VCLHDLCAIPPAFCRWLITELSAGPWMNGVPSVNRLLDPLFGGDRWPFFLRSPRLRVFNVDHHGRVACWHRCCLPFGGQLKVTYAKTAKFNATL